MRRRGDAFVFVVLLMVYVAASRTYHPWQEREPDLAAAHLRLAGDYAGRGRVADAIAESEKAVHLAPDNPVAHYNLGCFLLDAGRLLEAEREFTTTLALAPGADLARIQLQRLRERASGARAE